MESKIVSGIMLTLLLTGMLALALKIEPVKAKGAIVLVVVDPDFLDEYFKSFNKPFYDRLLSNGYVVTVISHSEVDAFDFTLYDAAVVTWDPKHITEPKDYNNLLNSGIGLVFWSADVEKVGLGSGAGLTSYGIAINIVDNTHYITFPFPIGNLEVYLEPGYRNYMQRATETTLLANIAQGDIIVTKDNKVYLGLPWGEKLTSNGWILFDRSVEFATSTIPPTPPIVSATLDIDPDTLNLRSKGRWISAYIQLPEGYSAADINSSTVLVNETISPVLDPEYGFVTNSSEYLVDHKNDGILERMVKFDRARVEQYILNSVSAMQKFKTVTLTVSGRLNDGTPFQGSDTIKIILSS